VKTLEEQRALRSSTPSRWASRASMLPVARIAAVPEYQETFRKVFGGPPNARDLVRAITSYERTQLSFDSPFDRFIAGDSRGPSTTPPKRGWELFNTRCSLQQMPWR